MAIEGYQNRGRGGCSPYSSSVQTTMPPELVILVLAHMRDDKVALSKCSLVCRGWVPFAYQHLFRVVTMHKPRRGLRKAVDRLLMHLCAAPYLGTYVQELVLTADELAPASHQMLRVHDLHALFAALGDLRALRISHAHLVSPPLADPWVPPAVRWKLPILALSSITTPSGSLTLTQVLGFFSEVGELCLNNFADCPLNHAFFRTETLSQSASSKLRARPHVKSVTLRDCCPPMAVAFLWSLRNLTGLTSLKALSLHILDLGVLTVLGDIIHSKGLALHHLELDLLRLPLSYDTHELQYEFNVPAISTSASLQSLHFTMMVWMHDNHANRNRVLWRCFVALLLDVAETVRDVRITLHTAELRTVCVAPTTESIALRQLSLLDWRLLDRAILRSPLLKNVILGVVNGDSEHELWLEDAMPEMLANSLSSQALTVLRAP